MSNRTYIFTMSELPQLKGIDQLEFYGNKQLIPAFKGWHQSLQRKVIVRLFPVTLATDPAIRIALEMLMRQINHCRHPGITEYLEFNEITLQDGRYYCLVSEWFSDESQNDWLIQYGLLDEENAFLVLEHTATVLTHYWNNCRIAHGNLKPKNILIDKDDNIKIDGFGLTTLLMLIAPPELKVNIGTPAFMEPELIKDRVQPDCLSDIYALGTTLSYLLTGLPDADHKPSTKGSHSQKNVSIHVPMSLEMGEIIRRMTAEHRENRFPSWEAVWEAIEKYKKTYESKADRNKKTQTIKIPVCENNITQMIEIGGELDSFHVVKENKISKPAGPVVPVTMKSSLKLRTPVSVPKVKARDTWVPRANRTASGTQIKEWIIVVASLTFMIVGGILGYLRFVKDIDVFKPVRNKIALAYFALTGGNYALVDKSELNDLMTDAGKPSVILVTQEVYRYTMQADGSVTTNESSTHESKDKPKADTTPAIQYDWKGTNADGDISQSKANDEGEEKEEAQDNVAPVKKPHKSESSVTVVGTVVEDESNSLASVQSGSEVGQKQDTNMSAVTVASVAVPGTGKKDAKLDVLLKKAESDDAEAQCNLGDYYDSINDKESALEWYRKAAERNLPKGLCRYGKSLMIGEGTQTNEIEAAEMFKKAAAMNDPEGQCLLANCLLKGQGVPKNREAAVQMFQFAAAQTNAESYCRLGECALNGIGMAKNVNQAMLFFKKSADMKYSPAYYQMGEAYDKGLSGVPNSTTALSMYKKAAEMNNIKAKCKLVLYYAARAKNAPSNREEMVQRLRATATNSVNGINDEEEKTMLSQIYILYGDCLVNGTYMKENLSEGVRLYEKAAKAGNFKGAFKYGMCLLNGRGVQQNESEGFNLLMTAAKGEYANAIWMIGECYLNGKGVERDSKQAELWFSKAANNDVPEAQYRMGEFCLDGTNKESNNKTAFEWFLKAAKAGYKPAIEKVIECYKNGTGVEKNIQNAILWRNKLQKSLRPDDNISALPN